MNKSRAYISFDFDHDSDLKALLVGQARNPNSPFEIVDMSIKEVISDNWKANARRRIKSCDVVIVICGQYTNTASGVSSVIGNLVGNVDRGSVLSGLTGSQSNSGGLLSGLLGFFKK